MPKREVAPFIFNIIIFKLKCGPLKSWGHKFYVKLPQFLVLPSYSLDYNIFYDIFRFDHTDAK